MYTKQCFGCGVTLTLSYSKIFCTECTNSISEGKCVECGDAVTHIDEYGRCAVCSITSDAKYPTNNTPEDTPMCACNLKKAKYEGAVCPECTDIYWNTDEATVATADTVAYSTQQIVPLTKKCANCKEVYIKNEELYCFKCKKELEYDK